MSTLTPPRAPEAPRERAGHGGGLPNPAEQRTLAAGLGAALRALRAEAGMTQRTLAARSGVSLRSVQDLEAGRRRPSTAMLRAIAVGSTRRIRPVPGLDPEEPLSRLLSAVGGSLVVDTPGGVRRRERRLRDAGHAYRRAVETWWQGEVAAAQQAELHFVAAIDILDLPGALDDARLLELANRHLDAHRVWMDSGRLGPWGTTSEFRKMAARHGYPVSRRRAAK